VGKEFRYQAINSGKILAIYHMHDLQVQYIIILVSQYLMLYPIFSLLDSFTLLDIALLCN